MLLHRRKNIPSELTIIRELAEAACSLPRPRTIKENEILTLIRSFKGTYTKEVGGKKTQKKEKSNDFSGLVAYPDKISNLISALQTWEKVSKNWASVKLRQIEAEKDLQKY